jgi:tetratricopeptide (TPR) repeat protein
VSTKTQLFCTGQKSRKKGAIDSIEFLSVSTTATYSQIHTDEQPAIESSMDVHKSKQNSFPSLSSTTTLNRQRIVQNFLLIWMDASIDQSKKDCQNTLAQLRNIVNDVHLFTDPDQCVDFLSDIKDMNAFIIADGSLGQHTIPLMHDIPQLDSIYIFCGNKSRHEEWAKKWTKVKGVHTEIKPICEILQLAVKQCNEDSIAVSFMALGEVASSQNLNELEASFMYTQIFKEILLEMKHELQAIKDLAVYCRKLYNDNVGQLTIIKEFERDYRPELSIWWYTRECFTYQMLNRALRNLEGDTIINMGFFIHDLHRQIEGLHKKQVSIYHGKPFFVYRGQGLSTADFDKLQKTKGGLMSFNNFLSTSKVREVSLGFAKRASRKTDMVGILFQMSIDPSVSSAPFAAIRDVSYFMAEEEILFSMHTVFRIGEITKLDKNNPLYQVELKLTADDDEQLRTLTERIGKEAAGRTGWQRLGGLLLKLNQFDKAEELYKVLLEQTSDESEKALYYTNLGYVKHHQGDYEKAICNYEQGLEIYQKNRPPNHPSLATSYNNIGAVYNNMGEYSKALSFHEKALEIREKTLPPNHPSLATAYNNIGLVYDNMGEYSKALSFYEKTLVIRQKSLPPNHPDLAQSYNNIGLVYDNMGEYSKALSLYEKTLVIRQKSLPPNHPDLAQSCNNIGAMYENIGEYSKALSFHEKTLVIRQKSLPPNHPDFAQSYNNIGAVYHNMGEYSKALLFHEKALEIWQKTLPPNHPLLATSYNSTARVYDDMGEYSKALSFHEKTLVIRQKSLPPNHPDFAQSYNNIGLVYNNMGEYSKALLFHEKALEIWQKTLPPNHPSLAASYNNIGSVYKNMGEYSKALSFYEKAVEIWQKTLPPNHPSLATSYNNIGLVYNSMGEYPKALSFYEKDLEICQNTLPPNHPSLATSYNNIGLVYYNIEEHSTALSYFERALNILQRSLAPNHPNLKNVRESIQIVKKKL